MTPKEREHPLSAFINHLVLVSLFKKSFKCKHAEHFISEQHLSGSFFQFRLTNEPNDLPWSLIFPHPVTQLSVPLLNTLLLAARHTGAM